MLWHAIAPSRRYTKASHDVVRHPRLCSDAKVLILYVQGLPDGGTDLALSEHARKLDIKGRAYQRAKEQLLLCGFVHERRIMGERGRWVTQQVFSNVPLADAEVSPLWCDAGLGVAPSPSHPSPGAPSPVGSSPSARFPTVGQPGPRTVGHQLPVDEEREKNSSHPPTETPCVTAALEPLTAEEVQAERVLLSLRHVSRGLHLGVAEARVLVGQAVEWLRRGVSVGELRRVLSSDLPEGGVRSAVGFLRHRLAEKMPEATVSVREVQPKQEREPMPMPMPMPMPEQGPMREQAPEPVPEPSASDVAPPPAVPRYVPPLVTCPGPGPEHVFRAMAGEAECPDCRQAAAWARWAEHRIADLGGDADGWQAQEQLSGWRGRLAAATAAAAARQEQVEMSRAGADVPVPGGEQVAAGHGIGIGIG
ncbi:hypothetical protein ACH4KO_15420 [Streptomyces anulatus]